MAKTDDDGNNDPDDYDNFQSEYDLDDDGIFDNIDTEAVESFVCMTLTDAWLSPKEQYDTNIIWIRPSVFHVDDKPSVHPNFFNRTTNDSCICPYTNDNPISNSQILHHALVRSSMRTKRGDRDKSIEHYDALRCKLQ